MDRLQRLFQGAGAAGAGGGPPADTPQVDTAEQIYISSLALLKMLKHGERQLRQLMLSYDQWESQLAEIAGQIIARLSGARCSTKHLSDAPDPGAQM